MAGRGRPTAPLDLSDDDRETLQRWVGLCCDMSAAFIAGARHYLANAQLVFDRYHITANLNAAVDEVRKGEARNWPAARTCG